MVATIAVSSPKSSTFQNGISLRDPYSNFLGGSSFKGLCLNLKPRKSKNRDVISLVVASASNSSSSSSTTPTGGGERFYLNFTGFPFPLGPFLNRRTIRTEAVKGCIWLFEQEQALGFSSVSTNIRMTVIKLKSEGLWVHAPIAPTKECIQNFPLAACEGVRSSSRIHCPAYICILA
ncbi:DNA primase [Actinidia chinensis var. chinensis]|uniref:DNA primase n=1 Tax=Actinidia chinensis var. chinensis TaxID=1590841 RepID=A0A2R6RKG5_ACTCC|nr:DNA primase [Actinidia chinensis var. chinensis]